MLTDRQQEAFETFTHWLRDEGNLFAKLKGYAGTGKTFLVNHIIKEARKITVLRENKESGMGEMMPFRICVTAPTHQAKKVIAKFTNSQARTIQSLIGLAPNMDIENFDINNPAFAVKNPPAMPKFDLVVIDEFSMVPQPVLDIIIATAIEHGVKILVIYDAAQLAPIGEDNIPIDDAPEVVIGEELTEIIRTNKSNPILTTFTKIRQNLFKPHDAFTHEIRVAEDRSSGEYYIKNRSDFEVRVVKRFWNLFQSGNVTSDKILAWTNGAVNGWNTLVRTSIKNAMNFTDEMSQYFFEGEPLVSYSTLEESIIINSEEFFLKEREFVTKSWEYYERDKETKAPIVDKPLTVDIRYIQGRLEVVGNPDRFEIVTFVVPTAENYKNFLKVFFWFHSFGIIDRKWPAFYVWKNQNLLIRDVVSSKKKLICKKDFDYSYAVTVHKSQGSTYDNVYIDEPDIDKLEDQSFCRFIYNSDLDKKKSKFDKAKFLKDYPTFEVYYNKMQVLKNRLKYVAMSRCRYFMVMYTKK